MTFWAINQNGSSLQREGKTQRVGIICRAEPTVAGNSKAKGVKASRSQMSLMMEVTCFTALEKLQ